MNVLGFYRQRGRRINISKFLIQNFRNFAPILLSSRKPNWAYIASDKGNDQKPSFKTDFVYYPTLSIRPPGSEISRKINNMLVIDCEEINTLFAEISSDNLLFILWHTVFHELRHFAQTYIVNEFCRLPLATLATIATVNSDLTKALEKQIDSYLKDDRIDQHIDAAICARLAAHYVVASRDGISRQKIKEFLLLTQEKFNLDPAHWIPGVLQQSLPN